jgi:hypothetical protein
MGIWALNLRPDNAIPQPGSSRILITFGPHHPIHSPIIVTLWLDENALTQTAAPPELTPTLTFMITGEELKQPGWSVDAYVPGGVEWNGEIDNQTDRPRTPHIAAGADGFDVVSVTPGAMQGGEYEAQLQWNDLSSGPLQVAGSNLVAKFPEVDVFNQSQSSMPSVTLRRYLEPWGDYAYLGGLPPDHQDGFHWSWNPSSGRGPGYSDNSFEPITAEARDASVDEKSHNAEFLSGVLFGVAAAAFIAAVQEFMNGARKTDTAD